MMKNKLTKQRLNITISLVAGCFLLILCCNNLGAQGLYTDELHQAVASFAYTGKTTGLQMANLTYHNIPILNNNYSGAIKTAIYGLYMRIFHQFFGVISWRLVGILMVCVGLLSFGMLVRKIIPPLGLAAFYFLTLTDCTVLLTTRHDWGPTALALFLRLIVLGIWLHGEASDDVRPWNTFLLLLLLGISLFEKLSNVVLVIPMILMIFLNPSRWKKFHLLAAGLGGIIGGLPLILANWLSFTQSGILISLQLSEYAPSISFFPYVQEYLSLGAGKVVQSFILGVNSNVFALFELVLLLAILLAIVYIIFQYRSTAKQFRTIGILLICYFIIMIQIFVFFRTVNLYVHHWIIGTPFQYLAIALFIGKWKEKEFVFKKSIYKTLLIALLVIFSLFRTVGIIRMENFLSQGVSSIGWDISQTQFAEFAASKSNNAYFMLTDWIEGSQLTCFMNGHDESVLHSEGVDSSNNSKLLETVKNGDRTELYIIFTVPANAWLLTPEKKQLLLYQANRILSPEWKMVLVEQKISNLRSLDIVKYEKTIRP